VLTNCQALAVALPVAAMASAAAGAACGLAAAAADSHCCVVCSGPLNKLTQDGHQALLAVDALTVTPSTPGTALVVAADAGAADKPAGVADTLLLTGHHPQLVATVGVVLLLLLLASSLPTARGVGATSAA
jgi:hypothetical protein